MSSAKAKFGVMGWPVEHSLSPVMHNAAFDALDIDAGYSLIPARPGEVASVCRRLQSESFSGWNVTVPHKEEASRCMDRLDSAAAAVSSVNTVVVEPEHNRLAGYSTDGYGLQAAVREHFQYVAQGNRLAFIGGGGAVAATAVHMALEGAAEIVLINRTLSKVEKIAASLGKVASGCQVDCLSLNNLSEIERKLSGIPLLIQATSLGLRNDDPLPLNPEVIPRKTAVMDMIYWDTPFLLALKREGYETADGLSMLLYQAVRSFFLWTGREAPIDVMKEALKRARAERKK